MPDHLSFCVAQHFKIRPIDFSNSPFFVIFMISHRGVVIEVPELGFTFPKCLPSVVVGVLLPKRRFMPSRSLLLIFPFRSLGICLTLTEGLSSRCQL